MLTDVCVCTLPQCPPVGVAIATERERGVSHASCSELQFDVVELSDRMGWDSGPVKRELKLLQWNMTNGGRNLGVDAKWHVSTVLECLGNTCDCVGKILCIFNHRSKVK